MNWLIAIGIVVVFITFAFKGTDSTAFLVDIILVIIIALVLNSCGL